LRQDPFDRAVPAGARAWRILYTTTSATGAITVASAIVMIARDAPAGPRPVVAWMHGTTGVAPGCAPSLLPEPFANVPALRELLAAGWIYVGTDYVGLGTTGPNPYFIGAGEARSALDSVRAARQMAGLQAGDRTIAWGHSQGGHAALWTAIEAPRYAPEIPLAGVVAMAPVSDVPAFVETQQGPPFGRVVSSFVLRAYSETYADVAFGDYVHPWLLPLAHDMARRCLWGRGMLLSLKEASVAGGTIFATSPTTGALGLRLRENNPDQPMPEPLLIAQGLDDDLVLPDAQARYVRRLCDAGQALEYRTYAGRGHLSLVAPDSPLTADLMHWSRARLAGEPSPPGCQRSTH
jgi:acetyl esterase/lipase